MDLPPYVRTHADGVVLELFVRPRAARDAVVRLHGRALKVKVTAPPVEGRANEAVETLLAGVLDIARARVAVTSGRGSRTKRVVISGLSPEEVLVAIDRVLSSRAHEPG